MAPSGPIGNSASKALVSGTVYYVDPAAGNDASSGTSTSTPWKSLSKVSSITYNPGDQILFKSGTTINGQFLAKGSGSSGSPIIVASYGTGAKPTLNGNSASTVISLNNVQYWDISNIQITNTASTDADRVGVYITATDAGTLNYIHLTHIDFHDIRSRAPNYTPGSNESAGSWAGAIIGRIFGSKTPTRYNDVLIANNTFNNTDKNMMYLFDSTWSNNSAVGFTGGAGNMFNSTNVVIEDNVATNIPGTGVCLCFTDGALVQNNTIDNAQDNVPSNVAGVAMSSWGCNNAVFQFNEVMNTHGTADGQAFDNDGGCQNVIFQYNYSHDNAGGFYMVCSAAGAEVRGAIFRYNVSQNDHMGTFDHRPYSYGSLIYNNTIFVGSGLTVPLFRPDTTSTSGTATFSNNIVQNSGNSVGGDLGSFNWSNNIIYGNYTSRPASTNTDPLLAAPGSALNGISTVSAAYKLQTGSPAIGTGIAIANNGGRDFFGDTLSSPPNIGIDNGTPVAAHTDLALGASASASNIHSSPYAASYAIDGNLSTRWATSDGTTACWLEVDFPASTTFDKVSIDEAYGPRINDYQIQYWTGSAWANAYSGSAPTSAVIGFPTVTSTKIRLNILDITGSLGPSVWEFAVYNY
jgi:hypothetical protein